MPENFSDLISEFGSKNVSEYSDLISEFGSKIEPTKDVPTQRFSAQPPPVAGGKPLTEEEIQLAIERGKNNINPSSIKGVMGAISNLPSSIWETTKKEFKEGLKLAESGITEDIPARRAATGVGKIGLGALQAAASPISAVLKEGVEKPVTELTGNPEAGKRAALALPTRAVLGKVTKVATELTPSVQAVNSIIEAVGDNKKLVEGIKRLKENPRLSVVDVFPSVLQDAQKLAVTEGKHQTKLSEWSENRAKSSKNEVENIYNTTTGVPVNVLDKIEQMKANARETGKTLINPVIKSASHVDVTPIIANIDKQLKPGVMSRVSAGEPLPSSQIQDELKKVRSLLTDDKSVRTNAEELNVIQSNIRKDAETLLKSEGQDRRVGYALMNVRNNLVNAIDKATGGKYKEALGKYADDMQVQEAFDKGREILRNRPTIDADRPEFWKRWVDTATKDELDAVKEGARIAIDQQIHGMRFAARQGTNIPEVDFNKEKLKLLFGEKEVNQMNKLLADEKAMAETHSKLFQNSQTAMRLKSNQRIDLPEYKKTSPLEAVTLPVAEIAGQLATGTPLLGAGLYYGGKAISGGFNKSMFALQRKLSMKKNEEYTNLITAEGEARNALIKELESYIPGPKANIKSIIYKINSRLPIAPQEQF